MQPWLTNWCNPDWLTEAKIPDAKAAIDQNSKIYFSSTSINHSSLHHLSVDTIRRLPRTKLCSKAKKLLLTLRMLANEIRFGGQYRHLTENSGSQLCSQMNQSWREVYFWIWYFCKDLVFVTPLCHSLPFKHYIILSWDVLISSSVLNTFLILSYGHNPLSSSG